MQRGHKKISFSFLDQFSIQYKNPDTVETILRNRETKQLVLMKEINIAPEDYQETLATLDYQKKLSHQQLVSIVDYYSQAKNSLFLVLYEYCEISLLQEFNQRLSEERVFEESELWSIFSSLVLGLSYLQENNVGHGSVSLQDSYLNDEGIIKICDPTAATSSPYAIIENFFYSPQILRSLINGTSDEVNIFKSDAFSLGCCMLQLALMRDITPIFDYERGKINQRLLNNLLDELQSLNYYSDQFLSFIFEVLNFDCHERPDFIELKGKIFSMLSSINPSENGDDLQSRPFDIKSSISSLRKSNSNQLERQISCIHQKGTNKNSNNSLPPGRMEEVQRKVDGSIILGDPVKYKNNLSKRHQPKLISPKRFSNGFVLTTIMDKNQCREVCKTESDQQQSINSQRGKKIKNMKKKTKKMEIQISYVEAKAQSGKDVMRIINQNSSPQKGYCQQNNKNNHSQTNQANLFSESYFPFKDIKNKGGLSSKESIIIQTPSNMHTNNSFGLTQTLKQKIMSTDRPAEHLTTEISISQSSRAFSHNFRPISWDNVDNSYSFGKKSQINKSSVQFTLNESQKLHNTGRLSTQASLPSDKKGKYQKMEQNCYTDLRFLEIMREDTKKILDKRQKATSRVVN